MNGTVCVKIGRGEIFETNEGRAGLSMEANVVEVNML